MLALLVMASACAAPFWHKISHAGYRVTVPGDWVDFTNEEIEIINVGSKWEKAFLVLEKQPGKSAFLLDLHKKSAKLDSKTTTEEPLTRWFQFTGNGWRFRVHDRNNTMVIKETVIFFPEGELSAYYIYANINLTSSGSQEEFNSVIKSLGPL